MEDRDVSYRDSLIEFLQDVFPAHEIVSAVMRATIEGGYMVLPEIYVNFEKAPRGAEQKISDSVGPFIHRQAKREGAKYRKTLLRVVVDDIDSLDGLTDQPINNWY